MSNSSLLLLLARVRCSGRVASLKSMSSFPTGYLRLGPYSSINNLYPPKSRDELFSRAKLFLEPDSFDPSGRNIASGVSFSSSI